MACGENPPHNHKRRIKCAKPREVFIIAAFYNQATLSYSGGVTRSNITAGELVSALTVDKVAVSDTYAPGDTIVYALSIVNGGETDLAGIEVTDDLGGYEFDGETLYPLAYVEDSVRYFIAGVLQTAPTVEAGPPLVISGLDIPAGSNVLLLYAATVTEYAPLGEGAEITNTATVSACSDVTACETITMEGGAELAIIKAVSPAEVTSCGTVAYTITVQNSGAADAAEDDAIVITDTFDPALQDIAVTLDGAALTEGVDYTYDPDTGEFATVAGRVTVPAATFAQDEDGVWTATPGVAALVITGTI